VANGPATLDECATCDADAANGCTRDCKGVWGGDGGVSDECDVCGGQNDCIVCALGHEACDPGECKANPKGCRACVNGTQSAGGTMACTACDDGHQPTPEVSSCMPCAAGKAGVAGACAACAAGTAPDVARTSCVACGAGKRSVDGRACEFCPGGSQPNAARTGCVQVRTQWQQVTPCHNKSHLVVVRLHSLTCRGCVQCEFGQASNPEDTGGLCVKCLPGAQPTDSQFVFVGGGGAVLAGLGRAVAFALPLVHFIPDQLR
jgi:hypothetical protein